MAGPDLSALSSATAAPAKPPDLTALGPAPATASAAPDLTKINAQTPSAPDLTQLTPVATKKDEQSFGGTMLQIGAQNVVDLVDDLNEMVKSPSMLGKGWGALKSVGAALSLPFTPVQAALQETVGVGVEKLTGGAVSKHTAGELATLGSMFFLDPLGGLGTAGRLLRGSKIARDVESRLSPTTMSEGAGEIGRILSYRKAEEHVANVQVENELGKFQGMVNRLPETERIAFMDRIMLGAPQPNAKLGAVDTVYRGLQARTTKFLQDVGKVTGEDVLTQANDNYLGIIWEHKDQVKREAEKVGRQANRPFLGGATFLRPKTYKTVSQGLADPTFSADFRLATTDPVKMMLMKFQEQHRFGYAKLAEHEMKQSGIPVWVPYWKSAGPGMVELDDRIFKPVLPPLDKTVMSEHVMTSDPKVQDGLVKIADALNFKIETPLVSQDPLLKGSHGYSIASGTRDARVVSEFGNMQQVLEHEVGHKLDDAFHLWEFMSMDKKAWKEMGQLALLRYENVPTQLRQASLAFIDKKYPYSNPSVNYLAYILSGKERMANFFHAYWYAPDLVRKYAPTAFTNFEKWMAHTARAIRASPTGPSVEDLIRGVQPSLRIGKRQILTEKQRVRGLGLQIPGKWMAPEAAARVFNNFVNPSSFNTPLFQSFRQFGMGLNMLQLGLSAFHATFTTVDVMVSQMARSIESLMQGHFGAAAVQALAVPTSAFTTVRRGAALRKNLLDMAPSKLAAEEQALMQMFKLAGGRIRMDAFYRASEHSLFRSLKNGSLMREVERGMQDHPYKELLALPFKVAGAAISDISHPVMDYLVPRQKLGVFSNLAHDWIVRHPGASEIEMRKAAQKIWDSVDNRLGQMVYDNVFWTKTFKDLMFMVTRSVGWNLGTIRELGGGSVDFAKAAVALRNGDQVEFTHRMAYAMAMPIVTGMIGATMTYLYTGHGPTQIMDYFFPPTGRKTPRGQPERVMVPSYMKDVMEYDMHPVGTLASKVNPSISWLLQMYNNRDFYGGLIRDPQGSFAVQARDMTNYIVDQLTPFSVRGARRLAKEKSPVSQQVGSFFGFQPAPAFITDPKRAEAWQRRQDMIALRRRERMRGQQ